jgi:hypothetical protein
MVLSWRYSACFAAVNCIAVLKSVGRLTKRFFLSSTGYFIHFA